MDRADLREDLRKICDRTLTCSGSEREDAARRVLSSLSGVGVHEYHEQDPFGSYWDKGHKSSQDVLSEWLLKILEVGRADVDRLPQCPRAHFRVSVRHRISNTKRSHARHKTTPLDGDQTPDSHSRPAEAELEREEVRAAVAALSEQDRILVLWRYADGLETRAIAAQLGITEVTVRQRLSRAVRRLRASNAGWAEEAE